MTKLLKIAALLVAVGWAGWNVQGRAESPAVSTSRPADDVSPDPELSIFGIGSSAMRSSNHPQWMPQMVAIGIRDCRATYGCWGIEQEEGKFDFTKFDERLAYDKSLGVQDGVLFNGVPPWKRTKEKGLPMLSLPEWTEMVKKTVEHTKGRVKRFEVWNEPPNGTGKTQTAADFAKLVATTYDAAKSVNPDAMIGMAAKSASLNYLDQAMVHGAIGHFDYITLHPYELLGCVISHPGTEPVYLSIVPNTRKMLAARDPSKVNVPVIFTEIGVDTKPQAGESRAQADARQAQAVLKAYIMGIHQGVACINYFEGMDGDSGPLGLLDGQANPRPAYHALGRLIEQVGRHPTSIGWVMLNDKHYGFMMQGAHGPVLGTWTSTVADDEADFGQDVEILDPVSGATTKASKCKLTVSPILVLNPPQALVESAKANKGKPLPWGGDFSTAKSVSVVFADKYSEKGLHTMAADSIAADVAAYQGNAAAGVMPKGGEVFYIDPNFLSYDTVPIEITVMAKRNEHGDQESLSLEYESSKTVREGYARTPELEIPQDNAQWQKLTWKIDDDQFVGTWAFHFRIQGDAKKYRIQSVTLTRLDR